MKKVMNKRWILLTSAVMVLVMATAGFAVSGFKGQFGGPFGGKGFKKERVLSKLDYAMQELKLTPAQQSKYSTIRERMSENMDQAMARRTMMRETVRNEMSQENPDINKLAATMKKEARSKPDMITTQIDSVLEIYNILDKNQQAQFVKMVKERMERMGHRHGKMNRMDRMDTDRS